MHYSLHLLTVGIQDLCNDIKQSYDEGKGGGEEKKMVIHQWDVDACGIPYSLPIEALQSHF